MIWYFGVNLPLAVIFPLEDLLKMEATFRGLCKQR